MCYLQNFATCLPGGECYYLQAIVPQFFPQLSGFPAAALSGALNGSYERGSSEGELSWTRKYTGEGGERGLLILFQRPDGRWAVEVEEDGGRTPVAESSDPEEDPRDITEWLCGVGLDVVSKKGRVE